MVSANPALATILLIFTGVVPVFAAATGCDALTVPTCWFPKANVPGVNVTAELAKLPAWMNTLESRMLSTASAIASLMW